MKELDVSKPMMFRNNSEVTKVEFVCSYKRGSELRTIYAFLVTRNNGAQYLIDRWTNGRVSDGYEDSDDIINIPEKPAFNWDKPIRSTSSGNICIGNYLLATQDVRILIFKNTDNELTYHKCMNNRIPEFLENYEPEEKYMIRRDPDFEQIYRVLDIEKYIVIAGFNYEKDAKLFKRVKEQGL